MSAKVGGTGRDERQPRLFEDNVPTNATARRGLWLDPTTCPHLAWDKTETTYPNTITVARDGGKTVIDRPDTRLTWTCMNCGATRGRV